MELSLKDTSITINGFVSYCKCKCKHCLLCSGDDKIQAVPYEKLEELALKFKGFRTDTGVDAGLCVYNCSDYRELPRAMEVNRQISAYSGYQNLNGTPIIQGKELTEWVKYLKNDCGVTNANLSWFGTESCHDEFMQKQGYFSYLLELAEELQHQNIAYHNTVFILRSNLEQLEEVYNVLLPDRKSVV